jgi:hypothetical protein
VQVRIDSTTVERLEVELVSRTDPTGGAVEFSFTTAGASNPGTWVAGGWTGAWSTANGRVKAVTPTIGSPAAQVELPEGATYRVWVRWTSGAETPVKQAGFITVF